MLTSLRLQNFRCFETLSLALPESGAIFLGANAQGKTSILEALCVAMRLHSPRTHRLAQVVKVGEPFFGVAVSSDQHDWKVRYQPGNKMLLDSDNVSINKPNIYLAETKILVWMANEDLFLVRGGGDARRRFLDFIGSQISLEYRNSLHKYRRALKARNLLLKAQQPDAQEINAYTFLLVEHGTILADIRHMLIEKLNSAATEMHKSVSSSHEQLQCAYTRAGGEDLEAAFAQARERELSLRQTVVGPHRDDMELLLNGLSASDFGSEGQQRTLAISLKLAQGALLKDLSQKTPVYLIDDVFGELDARRRNAFLEHLPFDSQRFVTTTHADWLGNQSKFPRFQVDQATVSEL